MSIARGSEPAPLSRLGPVGVGSPVDRAVGDRRRTGSGHIDSYGDGRVCRTPGCGTRLSRYNGSAVCWLHADGGTSFGGPRRR